MLNIEVDEAAVGTFRDFRLGATAMAKNSPNMAWCVVSNHARSAKLLPIVWGSCKDWRSLVCSFVCSFVFFRMAHHVALSLDKIWFNLPLRLQDVMPDDVRLITCAIRRMERCCVWFFFDNAGFPERAGV